MLALRRAERMSLPFARCPTLPHKFQGLSDRLPTSSEAMYATTLLKTNFDQPRPWLKPTLTVKQYSLNLVVRTLASTPHARLNCRRPPVLDNYTGGTVGKVQLV